MCPFFLTRILSIPSFFGSKVVADKIYPNFRNLKISCWSAAPLLQIRNERIGQKAELLSIIERKNKGSLQCQYIHIFLRKLFPLYLSWYICRLHIPSLTLVPPLMAYLAKRLHFFKTIKTDWNCSPTKDKIFFSSLGRLCGAKFHQEFWI